MIVAAMMFAATIFSDPQLLTLDPEAPISTERPGFGDSTEVLAPGGFQLEMGYTFAYNRVRDVRTRSHTGPDGLLRVGVFAPVELRLGWSGYSWQETHARTESDAGRPILRESWSQGANELSISAKAKIFDEDGLRPDFAIITTLSVPSGSPGFSNGDVVPDVRLVWGHSLTDDLSVGGNVNFTVPDEAGDRYLETATSVSLSYAVADNIGAFVEYFGIYPSGDRDTAHSMDGGFTFLVDPSFQIDVSAGVGLNEAADDFFVVIGFAWRL